MRTRNETGRLGEALAARYLELNGFQVLERNWYGPGGGELDVVAYDVEEDAVVGVEVKTRRSAAYGSPAEAVTPRKVHRLRVLLAHWLAQHDVHADAVRLDVVAVELPPSGPPRIEHLVSVG
ncbi:YraN family protein [Cellulomonas sp. Marseille-Q8402]